MVFAEPVNGPAAGGQFREAHEVAAVAIVCA